MYKTINIYFYR